MVIVDTLDSAAHGRSRLTWDTELPTEEQSVVDHALQRTVGCTPGKRCVPILDGC